MEMNAEIGFGPSSNPWTSRIEPNALLLDGCLSYRADIFKSLALQCSIVLSGPFADEATVERRLEALRDRWIAEYESRSLAP